MATWTGVIPDVRGEIRRSARWSILLSVLMIVSGVLAIIIPPVAGLAVTVMFGWLLIGTGALHLAYAWREQGTAAVLGEILVAVLYGGAGAVMLARPIAGLASLTLVIVASLFVKALLEGMMASMLRPMPGSGWLFLDAVVTLVIAATIGVAWPASAAWAAGVLVGVAMVSSGLARLMISTSLRRVVA